jgi:hypothetical protein
MTVLRCCPPACLLFEAIMLIHYGVHIHSQTMSEGLLLLPCLLLFSLCRLAGCCSCRRDIRSHHHPCILAPTAEAGVHLEGVSHWLWCPCHPHAAVQMNSF